MAGIMDWIGAISSGASSIIGSVGQFTTNRQNIKYAKEENALNRQFQSEEAEKARQYQTEFYQQYQSPSAMVKQYQDAGINPAVMYGSAGSATPPSGGSPSGGSSISAHVENPLASFIQLAPILALVKKTNAETKKIESETVGSDTYNRYADRIFQMQLNQGKAGIKQLNAATELALQQASTELERKGLVAFQKVLARTEKNVGESQALKNSEESIYLNWKNTFIKKNGYAPDNGLWNAVVSLVGSISQKLGGDMLGIGNALDFFKNLFTGKDD